MGVSHSSEFQMGGTPFSLEMCMELYYNQGRIFLQKQIKGEDCMEYKLDSHTHSIASGHAYNTIQEMAQAAAEKKMELLAITEHSMCMPGTCGEFYFHNLKVLSRKMCGIEVLFGVELNIMDFDGRVDMKEEVLASMDVAIASLHLPCIEPGSIDENTRALVKAIENPLINIIGHPDDGRYPVDYDTLAAAAAEHHVLLELNNTSLNPKSSRLNAKAGDEKMLEKCIKYKTTIIMNSDAHWSGDIGNCTYSEPLIREMGVPEELIVNRSVEEYKTYVNRYKNAETALQ